MKLLVYGSLREEGALHSSWIYSNPLKKVILQGFNLYRYASFYPVATRGDNKLVCELYDVEEEQFNAIKEMEENAGYHEETIEVSGTKASIFLREDSFPEHHLIKNGDWINYYTND